MKYTMKTAPTRDLLSDIFVSVTIPVHNEAENIDELCRRLTKTLETQAYGYEIIFIDDGSSDGTLEVLRRNLTRHKNIKIIKLQKNYGQHIALMAGIGHAKGSVILTMDGDLQNNPEDIPSLIEKIEEGYDFVSGWRVRRYDSLLRKIPSFFLNKLICRVTGVKLHDYNCGINAVRKSIIGDMRIHGERRKFFPALMATLATSICEVEVGHNARTKGKSQYDFFRLVGLVADFVTSFTIKPFRVIGVTGGALVLLSVLFGITYLAARAFGLITPMPKTIVTILIGFFSGVQFTIVGFAGEYLVRIYHFLQQKSLFEVESIIEE